MRAGELNRRVTLQKPRATRGASGDAVMQWDTVADVWAAIEPARGAAYFQSQKTSAEVQGTIRIRWRADIRPDWRIRYKDPTPTSTPDGSVVGYRYFAILAIINPSEGRQELQLGYKEMQNGEPI